MVKIIGIDLGTTNSCVSWIENGEPVIIVNQEGARVTPSVVAYTSKGEKYVGLQAKRQAVVNPELTVSGIKRLIGKRYTDPDIEELKKNFTCKIVPSENGEAWIEVGGQAYSPSEISAQVIGKLRAAASEYCGQEIKEAVIAVPAYFNDAQRQATRQAAALAGLNVRRIVNEPTLAALAYGYRKKEKGYFVVFDLGGGTFDVSVLEFREGAFHVLATAGDNRLGGSDFDRIIFDKILEKIGRECSHDVAHDKMAVQRIWEAAEVAKCELSTLNSTTISLPFLAMTSEGAYHLNFEMTRDDLESWVAPLVERLSAPCKDAMEQAGLKSDDIERVLLVGGMTRMPIVQKTVESIFGNKHSKSLNPDEIVAAGAAVQAGVFEGEVREIVLLDVTPLNLGIRVAGDKVATIIERNSVIPTRASKIFTTTENNQNFVTITVTQGDSPVASKNAVLGEFVLTGIPEGPAGQARIEVQFEIDADGVVSVSGVDKKTGIMQAITIHNGMGMTEEELERARVRF